MSRTARIPIVLCLLWLTLVGAGFVVLSNYQTAPGAIGATPPQWPSAAHLALDPARPTMILFAHPRCPCTRSTVEELNRILAQNSAKVSAHVLFFKPAGFSEKWEKDGLWSSVAAIPGVSVQEDPDGAQARLFGAQTSGYVVFYNPRGQLLFKGGITGSRGHAGDNAGEDAVISLLSGQPASATHTPVYGCSLLNECQKPTKK
ncbi:MAG TPA: hypothetical protein VGO59_13095 [Verrucomicrobiae bacterium]|jgi:hypothetical protein